MLPLVFIELLSSEVLPMVMQGIGLALVTILIPVVLFIFSHEKESLFEWDKIVILDKVIEVKSLMISIGFIFFPLLFWGMNNYLIKIIAIILFITGLGYVVKILINSYKWIKTIEIPDERKRNNFRNKLRNDYLGEIKNLEEKERVWSLTWRKEIKSVLDERNLIKKFIINIDALIRDDKLDSLAKYLTNFNEFANKRSFYDWVIFADFFPKLLEWQFTMFQKSKGENEKKRPLSFFEIERDLSSLMEKFIIIGLRKGTSYLLFEKLREHLGDKEEKYLNYLFIRSNICRAFFENISNSPEGFAIWEHYFPDDWKITKETYENENNLISKIWLRQFLHWFQSRFLENKKDFDKDLDEVSRELFPTTEPILWAKILTFLTRPWINDDRMKSLVEQPTNFGKRSRMLLFSCDSMDEVERKSEKIRIEETNNTIELTLLLFGRLFSKEILEKYIKELSELKCEENSKEDLRKKDFLNIFQQILSHQK